jgi:hypothetical protein
MNTAARCRCKWRAVNNSGVPFSAHVLTCIRGWVQQRLCTCCVYSTASSDKHAGWRVHHRWQVGKVCKMAIDVCASGCEAFERKGWGGWGQICLGEVCALCSVQVGGVKVVCSPRKPNTKSSVVASSSAAEHAEEAWSTRRGQKTTDN